MGALRECIEAARAVLSDTTQRVEKQPWIDPPYWARFECKYVEAVISTEAALDATTNANGPLLQAANTYPGTPAYTPALLEMGSTSDLQEIFSLQPQQGYMARVHSWGISAGPAGPKSISVRLKAAAAGGTPTPPDPFISGPESANHQDAFVVLRSKQELAVQVGLRDVTAGPILVQFGICYWLWPINKSADNPEAAIMRAGYGVNCP